MRILILRSNDGKYDSRVTKEMYSLSKRHEVCYLGWDRAESISGITENQRKIMDKEIRQLYIHIKAPVGGGFKKMLFPLLKFWIAEYRYVRRNIDQFDAIHACDFDTAFPLLFIKNTKIVYDIYDYYADSHLSPRIVDKMLRRFETKVIEKSFAAIICSDARKLEIYPAVPKRLLVIHNSPDIIFNQDSLNKRKPSNVCRMVYVGALNEDRCLSKVAEAVSTRTDVELHIGGVGPLEDYFKEMAVKYKNIIYYGSMEYEKVLELERQCDFMTAIYDPKIPCHKYAAPNKFYEALMLKKPLIMMRNTGMDSYVEEYQLGEVIDGGAESFKEGFSRALDNLIAKKEQWAEMGERGYKLYQEQFSWDEMEKRLLNLYAELESTI